MAKNDTGKKLAIGALIAGTVGFVTGILTAPKSGKETRKDIKKATKSAIGEVEKQLKTVHTELQSLTTKASKKLSAGKDAAKKDFDKAVDRAKDAQQRVKEILSAIHEGDADDPELKKALKEATAAKEHLQKYLSANKDTKKK